MFNLEQSIAQWRQQMLAAGISALALDELENHLREEIEARKGSGLNETETFQATVQTIGHGDLLRSEFNKAEENYVLEKAINSLIQIIGWIAAALLLVLGLVGLELNWSFISFKPTWSLDVFSALIHILIAETGIWFLAKVNRDSVSRVLSLLICLLLGWLALINYHDEKLNPIWYCWSTTLLLLLPGIFWITRRWPLRRKTNQLIAPAAIIAERIFSAIAALYIIFISVRFFQTGDGAKYFFGPPAALLAIFLIICGGCLASNHMGKTRRAR